MVHLARLMSCDLCGARLRTNQKIGTVLWDWQHHRPDIDTALLHVMEGALYVLLEMLLSLLPKVLELATESEEDEVRLSDFFALRQVGRS